MKYETNRIYTTTDYSIFKYMEENRCVSDKRKDKIKKSMEEVQLRSPIKVNEKMEIIDGQGRAAALQELGLPVEFFIAPGEGMKECIQMNKVNSKWSFMDFIDSFAAAGNVNYINLKRLISAHPGFPASLIMNITLGRATSNQITSGNLKLEGEKLVESQKKMEIAEKFKVIYPSIKGRKDHMLESVIKAVKYGMNADTLAQKMADYPGKITGSDVRTNLIWLEETYNYGMRADRRVYIVTEFDKENVGK